MELDVTQALVVDLDDSVHDLEPPVVEDAPAGFVENDWVGDKITIGSLLCDVFDDMRRCVMVTHPQGELDRDIEVLRVVVSENNRAAGVSMRAIDVARVQTGDEVRVAG